MGCLHTNLMDYSVDTVLALIQDFLLLLVLTCLRQGIRELRHAEAQGGVVVEEHQKAQEGCSKTQED